MVYPETLNKCNRNMEVEGGLKETDEMEGGGWLVVMALGAGVSLDWKQHLISLQY